MLISLTQKLLLFGLFINILTQDDFSASKKAKSKVCLSPEKTEVDWFVIFLFPETSNKSAKLSYGYFDNNSSKLSYYTYDEATFPGISVIEEYSQAKTNYFFWNDDTSTEDEKSSSSSGKAHSKGGLIFDKDTGVLISHSLPRFPRRTEDNTIVGSLPSNAGIYGQTFICISLDKPNSLKVVETLNIINPPLVLNVEKDLIESPSNSLVEKLIKNRQDNKLPSKQVTEVLSKAGSKFEIFSKGRNLEELPWDEHIPEYYKDGIYVETWTKPQMIPSTCDKTYNVVNVSDLKFGKFVYDKNQEHSK